MDPAPGPFYPETASAAAHAEAVARFSAVLAAGLPVPKDLGRFILEALQRAAGASELLRRRNRAIAEAAALVGAGRPYTKARALAKIAGERGGSSAPPDTAKGRLCIAARYGRLPTTPRQFANVLRARTFLMEIPPVETSIGTAAPSSGVPKQRYVVVRR